MYMSERWNYGQKDRKSKYYMPPELSYTMNENVKTSNKVKQKVLPIILTLKVQHLDGDTVTKLGL